MNKSLIYIPGSSLTVEDLMLLGIDNSTPDEDVRAIMQLNEVTCRWFWGECPTGDYLDLVQETLVDGAAQHLDRLDQVLRILPKN
ncbi:MAG: hypothetical protein ACKPEN_12265 [Planktothrix sp.]|uniref:hypothetical protein n=1 Tax=Planktothrix sp. TaxID=3088171 RepID=UPI0038D388B6